MTHTLSKTQISLLIGIAVVLLATAVVYAKYVRSISRGSNPGEHAQQRDSVVQTQANSDSSQLAFYSVGKLKDPNVPAGTYRTEGYILKKTTCPPDPQPGLSSPCPRDNIIVSEAKRDVTEIFPLTERDVVVFIKDAKRLEVGKHYRFKVKKTTYTNSQNKQESSFEFLEQELTGDN